MESPFTGGKAELVISKEVFEYRKEKFTYYNIQYKCVDTGEFFAPLEIENSNLLQVYNQYRALHGIPFPDEITAIRKRYGLSRPQMSKILGFGEHQLKRYEDDGEVPSESNGKTLSAIKNPKVFEVYLLNAKNQLTTKEFDNILSNLKHVTNYDTTIYKSVVRSKQNGLGELNAQKAVQAAEYVIDRGQSVSAQKLNATLLYADMLAYAVSAKSITGLLYQKNVRNNIDPHNFFDFYRAIPEVDFALDSNGRITLSLNSIQIFFEELTKKETEILDYVLSIFNDMDETAISEKIKNDFANIKPDNFDFDIAFSLDLVKNFL
ncbi:MAG: hypothetical protein J6Y24_00540 [Bacteroidales bacterium]|nr:hypothetical protein [Bacteroidales bacterium]